MKKVSKINKIFFKLFNLIFLFVFHIKEGIEKCFCTIHSRQKYSADFGLWSDELKNDVKTAIIIQGPIIKKSNFTIETIRIYKKLFRNAIIILSTWDDEDFHEIDKIKKENIEIILNKKPDYFGQQNINLQIVSSFSGIKMAKNLGAEYAVKTRTDQRIYAPNSLDFLKNIVDVFPLQIESAIQNKRIVGVSLNTFKYRPYSLSDMLTYGQIDDLLLYWGVDEDKRVFSDQELNSTLGSFAKSLVCEAYLMTEFVKKNGYEPKVTISDSWDAFLKYFCVIDQGSLDLYWYKYSRHLEYRRVDYKNILSSQPMTFGEWLNIYTNKKNKLLVPEGVLEKEFGSVVENTQVL